MVSSAAESPGARLPSGPDRQQRGVRVPQLLLSLLVVGVFALLAVWWQASTNARTPALALASDVTAGKALVIEDLKTIYVGSDVPTQLQDPEYASSFVGAIPIGDFKQGTIVVAGMFRRAEPLRTGQAFVGLKLDSARSPMGLLPGDRVHVIVGVDREAEILARNALVDAVRGESPDVIVRLRVGIEEAPRVQLLAEQVVLIEVPAGESHDPEDGGP